MSIDPYTLVHPISTTTKVNGEERTEVVSEVQLRRMNGGDIRILDTVKGENSQALSLIARLSGLDARTVDKMDAEDIAALGKIIEGFTPAGLQTGATS